MKREGNSKLKHTYKRLLSGALALLLALSGAAPAFAAEGAEAAAQSEAVQGETAQSTDETVKSAVYTYRLGAFGSVTAATSKALGVSATLTRYENRAAGEYAQTAFVVTASPKDGASLRAVNLGENLHVREKLSSLAGKYADNPDETLLAAVNADFFSLWTGVPMGVLVSEGRLISSSDGRDAVGFGADGETLFGKIGETITVELDGKSLAVSHVNKYPSVYGVYLLTRDYGESTTLTGFEANEYVLRLDGELTLGGEVGGEVIGIRENIENGEIPEGCAVLTVPRSLSTAVDYAALELGTRVTVKVACESGFEALSGAVGGGDIIVKDGKAVEGVADEDHEKTRQPRTALGVKADGSVLLFVVDGRQSGYGVGLTLAALADTMLALGCVDAINFDGGGSSALVLFDGETAALQNRPSDGGERKVANAVALFETAEIAAAARRLDLVQPTQTILAGAAYPIEAVVTDGAGETVEHLLTPENTTVTVDEAFGRAEIVDGRIVFTPAAVTGYGKITVETTLDGETLRAECFAAVTDGIDALSADATLLLADADGTARLTVTAYADGREVYYGDLAEVRTENPAFGSLRRGSAYYFAVGEPTLPEFDEPGLPEDAENPEADEAPAEKSPESGRVAVALLDKTVVVPAYFGVTAPIPLDGLLKDGMTVEGGAYTLTYDEAGGVTKAGAFVLTLPAEATAPEETTEATETAAPDETTTSETTETAESGEVDPDETVELREPAEPEPVPEPISVELCADGVSSEGLRGRRLWLWVDGLDAGAAPHAVFTLTKADGTTETKSIAFDAYYDLAGYNGRALLTLVADFESEGVLSLTKPLCFTATEARSVSVGPIFLAEDYDTNRYADLDGHWSSYYVNALSFAGVVGGSEDATGRLVYLPDDSLSREQFAKILVGFLKLDLAAYAETALPFDDNGDIAEWAIPYVRAAYGAGLMRGKDTPDGKLLFAPRDSITREETFYVLGGLLDGAPDGEVQPFIDSDAIAPWAAAHLQKSVAAGLVSGYDDGSLRPRGRITRAEAATVVLRLLDILYKTDAKS